MPDGFDDVFGSAIARAVRQAVDGVGREQGAAPPVAAEPEPEAVQQQQQVEAPPLPPAVDAADDDPIDPYDLIGVDRRAEWAEITAAYKARARAWHPDGAPPEEQDHRHELIRALNAAYAELRVRRGR